jgi:hypothetical protein
MSACFKSDPLDWPSRIEIEIEIGIRGVGCALAAWNWLYLYQAISATTDLSFQEEPAVQNYPRRFR